MIFHMAKRNVPAAIRRVVAGLVLLAVTALFLDLSGAAHAWLGWLAKIQLLPAIMAANFAVIAGIAVVTLLFGRIYCSVLCPLGIFQDGVSWLSGLRSGKRLPGGKRAAGSKKLRFGWLPERRWLRYGVLGLFVLALVFGVSAFVAVLAPYSAYGRMVGSLLQPVWLFGNNLLAKIAEHYDSYAFYTRDVWLKSLPTLIVAAVTFVALTVLAWWKGRVYCNTICPVGTALGLLSRFAMFRPVIDASKCKECKLCEKGCKASCIDVANYRIDYSRCVDCLDCLGECKFDALQYRFGWGGKAEGEAARAKAAGDAAAEGVGDFAESRAEGIGAAEAGRAVEAEATASGGDEGVKERNGAAAHTEGGFGEPEGQNVSNVQEKCTSGAKIPQKRSQRAEKLQVKNNTNENAGAETAAEGSAGKGSNRDGKKGGPADPGRRAFLVGTAIVAGTVTLEAQRKRFDGGLAALEDKREPRRTGRLVPPGARSANDFYSRCTACGLCVAACPNGVLRPSGDLEHLMQPHMSYERGYCRPECSECSLVCPTGAILPINPEQKTGISIGIAEVDYDLCVVNRDGVRCGNCARHCPTGAIHMVAKDPENERSPKIPSVDAGVCIGCGACENLCPSRPYSAIHVNGREKHIEL